MIKIKYSKNKYSVYNRVGRERCQSVVSSNCSTSTHDQPIEEMDLDESSSSGSSLLEPIQSLAGTTVNSPTVSYMTMPTNEEERSAHTASEGQIDFGVIIQEVNGSWDKLRSLVQKLPNEKKKQYLSNHFKPFPSDNLHSHQVTKKGKTWNVSFQLRWLDQFPWLSYSHILLGGICRYCILFPEQPGKGDGLGHGNRSGVLILSPYQSPYSKAVDNAIIKLKPIILK